MPGHLTKIEIEQQLRATATELFNYCFSLKNEDFFYQPVAKWSAAQQVKHLIASTDTAKLAFVLPKLIVRWIAGKPNRNSKTYDELLTKYKLKLQQGGRAGKRYVPKPIPVKYGKEKLLTRFLSSMNKTANAVVHKWNDNQMDQYIVPHPLLGKITMRELCYFTIFHTWHHLNSIKERMKEYELT